MQFGNAFKRRRWAVVVASCCVLVALGSSRINAQAANRPIRAPRIDIQLGLSGDAVSQRTGLPVKRSQVGGALLYDASPDRTGYAEEVIVSAGARQFAVPSCISVLFYDDTEEPHGVEQIDLRLRMPAPPADGSTEARLRYERQLYELALQTVQRINAAGWKRYISPAEPRLGGRDTLDLSGMATGYVATRGVTLGYDPGYAVSFDEWQRLGGERSWNWYADGVFVKLQYQKDPARGPGQAGPFSDSLQLTVETARLVFAKADPQGEGKAERAIDQERRAMPQLVQRRLQEEARARAAGLHVLQQWEDPVVAGVAVPKH